VTIPPSAELLAVARRLCWSTTPEQALAEPYVFLAHVMTLGTTEDVLTVRRALGQEAFREALEHAPAGVFDPRSWSYWNLVCDRWPAPPLPERNLG